MRRREFLAFASGAAAAWPFAVSAQQPTLPVIGFLHSGSPGPYEHAVIPFHSGLNEGGYFETQNVAIDYRWAEDQFDLLPKLATELVRRKVALIVVGGGDVTALAAKTATTTIPIVFVIGADPVRHGIVKSLNRPGGNVTGVSFLAVEIRPKMLELIREVVPGAETIALLANPNRPDFERSVNEVLDAAQRIAIRIHVLKAATEREIVAAFSTLTQMRVGALLVVSDPVYSNRREQIVRLEALNKIPAFHSAREFVAAGGLISYGASVADAYRQGGNYASRILKGEKPADLPVIQPTKFELVINLKTARALGLTIPPLLLARADEVIE